MGSDQFSAVKQLVFYGSYHSHPVNIAIHTCFIPLILWSGMVFFARLPVPDGLQAPAIWTSTLFGSLKLVLSPNWSAVQTVAFFIYYLLLEPTAAILFLPALFFILTTATAFAQRPDGLTLAIMVHAGAWIAQFLGHGLAERRAPALTDNVPAALVTAPLFVHMELLFALGYRPDLRKEVEAGVEEALTKFRAEKSARSTKKE